MQVTPGYVKQSDWGMKRRREREREREKRESCMHQLLLFWPLLLGIIIIVKEIFPEQSIHVCVGREGVLLFCACPHLCMYELVLSLAFSFFFLSLDFEAGRKEKKRIPLSQLHPGGKDETVYLFWPLIPFLSLSPPIFFLFWQRKQWQNCTGEKQKKVVR